MDVRFIISVVICATFCVFQLPFIIAEKNNTICEANGCNCSKKASRWIIVNCTLNSEEELMLVSGSIPNDVCEVFINGGNVISFAPKTFKSLMGLTILYINGSKNVHMESRSFYNLSYPNLIIQIQQCDHITIKTGSFDNMQCTMEAEIGDSTDVSIEESAFSKLHKGYFYNIKNLKLGEGTFKFTNQGIHGRHGQFTVITFANVHIPIIPTGVFSSSLAEIKLVNSTVKTIYPKAFRASEIEVVSLLNSSIDIIRSESFTDTTLIHNFKIIRCKISKLESNAIMAAISNFTVNFSMFDIIETEAVKSPAAARVEIIGNHITNFHSSGFIFANWDSIKIEQNIVTNLHPVFIVAPVKNSAVRFTFIGNEIHCIHPGALNFISVLDDKLKFYDNFFYQSCHCTLYEWIESLTNSTNDLLMPKILNSNYCLITKYLSECFNYSEGPVNMQNYTETICKNGITCNITNIHIEQKENIPLEDNYAKNSWVIFILTIIAFFIIAIIASFTVLLIRGGRWLKRKGYFRNIHYNQNDQSNDDDDNTVVTVDENEKLEIPEELSLEFLQILSRRLDNPDTHQEASEMIERLYEMFVVEDNYEAGNNKQDDEAHLYEELGNLNLQLAPPPYEQEEKNYMTSGPRGILKIMEERIQQDENFRDSKPTLTGLYSEPSDAAIHLYSELKQNQLSPSVLPKKASDDNLLLTPGSSKSKM